MNKHYLKKVVLTKKKKTHKKSFPKSQPELKQEKEKTRFPKRKTNPKQHFKIKAKLEKSSSQPKNCGKVQPSTHL